MTPVESAGDGAGRSDEEVEMYRQERVEGWFGGGVAGTGVPEAIGRKLVSAARAVGDFMASVAEPFRGPWRLELLDPNVRRHMSVREKAIVDAHLHGVL